MMDTYVTMCYQDEVNILNFSFCRLVFKNRWVATLRFQRRHPESFINVARKVKEGIKNDKKNYLYT
jgi:hypothetical protein